MWWWTSQVCVVLPAFALRYHKQRPMPGNWGRNEQEEETSSAPVAGNQRPMYGAPVSGQERPMFAPPDIPYEEDVPLASTSPGGPQMPVSTSGAAATQAVASGTEAETKVEAETAAETKVPARAAVPARSMTTATATQEEENDEAEEEEKTEEELEAEHQEALKKIQERGDDVDLVNGVLFKIGCMAKHKEDLTNEAFALSEEEGRDYLEVRKEIEERNIKQMENLCERGDQWARCQETCTWFHRMDETMDDRKKCHAECDALHSNNGQLCMGFKKQLAVVYDAQRHDLEAGNRCTEKHCPEYQNIVRLGEDEQEAKLAEQCQARYGDDEDTARVEKCKERCAIDSLNACVKVEIKQPNIVEEFCDAFWTFIVDTSEQPVL